MEINNTLLLHLCQLSGQGAAVNTQIVSPLDSSQRNLKIPGLLGLGLDGQIGQDFFTDGSLGDHFHLTHEFPVFSRQDTHHIHNDLLMKGAAVTAGTHDPVKGEKQDIGIFRSGKGHHRNRIFSTGEGFTKQLILMNPHQQGSISPEILLDHVHRTEKHQTNIVDGLVLHGYGFSLLKGTDMIADAVENRLPVLGLDSVEQGRADAVQKM